MNKIIPFPSSPSTNPGAPRLDSETWVPTDLEARGQVGAPDLSHLEIGVPTDLEARQQALNTRTSCIVEAPAGSGKTGLLMQRYLKLLAEPSVTQPEEVLAITFTNKATAELRERILQQLQLATKPPTANAKPFEQTTRTLAAAALARSTELQWNILDRPQRLNIRTIDSICAEIANSLPLLSGSGGSQHPTPDAKPLYRLAAQRTLLQLGSPNRILHDALRNVLLHRDGNLADVERLLAEMLADREQWGEIIPLTPGDLTNDFLDTEVRPKLERALESIVCAGLTRTLDLMPPGMLHQLTTLAAQLGLNPGYNNSDSPIAFCAQLHQPPAAVADHLDHWQALISLLLTKDGDWRKPRGITSRFMSFEFSKAEKAELEHLIETHKSDDLCEALCAVRELPPARYPDDQWQVTRSLFHVLRHALAELKLLFAERSTCDFTELAIEARQALASSDDSVVDLALTPGGRLRHLLVDEMQDTSAAQYDLIHLLTRTWDGATQTLFLVGDPKQSIYLFRQARVERFLRTMRDHSLGDIPLTTIRLTTNFRSQATLVHDFNHTFEQLFPSLDEATRTHNTTDVPFVAATPNRPATESLSIQWHPAITTPNHEQHQAREIRNIIERWQHKPLPANRTKPWHIAILARNRSHLTPIVAELKQAQIPYRAVDIDPLATRPEVLDALALTRALLHPADRVAWLAVLHAPWCGLSLTDLLALAGEGPDPEKYTDKFTTIATLIAANRNHLSPEGQRLLTRAWPTLEASIATLGTNPIATHIERTWRSLGGDAPLTTTERTNVLRFLGILREVATESTFIDLTLLQSRLDSLYAEPASGPITVELLTIHKAKGLEWDVVLVPNLERKSGSNSPDLLSWLEIDSTTANASPILLAPIASKGTKSANLNKWLNRAKEARENAERKRLFYVLATRAQEELHLFGAVSLSNTGELKQPIHGSLLKAIWPAAENEFNTLTQTSPLADQLHRSLDPGPWALGPDQPLALAASATPAPLIQRLSTNFNPLTRFLTAEAHKLPYTPASALRHTPTFDRPEGSFAVRAFGNVVHRYLQLLSTRLTIAPAHALLAELPTWHPRLLASLRGEGLSPTLAQQDATRALTALTHALNDPIGRWILSPQPEAFNELPLAFAAPLAPTLRVDRTFLAAAEPNTPGNTHQWIVDFKTGTRHGLSPEAFETEERAKYSAQLDAYATAAHALAADPKPVILALYYPLIPRLIFWPA
jgi:ATP-dependent helicase/nuclease subunit A